MMEVDKEYKTVSGDSVKIIDKINFPDFFIYRGDNNMDYDNNGKASFSLMFKGRFRSPDNDILLG